MLSKPAIAVAVITRNRPQVLRQCLEHLRCQSSAPAEIVVVDSSEGSQSHAVCQEFAEVTYVRFRGARHQMPASRNLAIRHSTAAVIAYLDDDCLVEPDWLRNLQEVYVSEPEVAGVGGRIRDARWPYDPAQPVGRVDALGRVISNFFGDPGGVVAVDVLPGGNMSFRREWLEAVGGFDRGYTCTNHREDPDLCLRIRRRGGALRYHPDAIALHLNARNSLRELRRWHEFFLRYSFSRNDARFVVKHFGNDPRAVWRIVVGDSVEFVGKALRSGSVLVIATIPVFFAAKCVGLIAGYWHRIRFACDGPHVSGGVSKLLRTP